MELKLRLETTQSQLQLQRLEQIHLLVDKIIGFSHSIEHKTNELKTYLLQHIENKELHALIEGDPLLLTVIVHYLESMVGMHESTIEHHKDTCVYTYIQTLISSMCAVEPSIAVKEVSIDNLVETSTAKTHDEYNTYLEGVYERGLRNNPHMYQLLSRLKEYKVFDSFYILIKNTQSLYSYLLSLKIDDTLLFSRIARQMQVVKQEEYKCFTGLFYRFLNDRPGFSNSKKAMNVDVLKHAFARLLGKVYLCSVGILDHQDLYTLQAKNESKTGYLHLVLETTKENIVAIMQHHDITSEHVLFHRWKIVHGKSTKNTQQAIRDFLDMFGLTIESTEQVLAHTSFNAFVEEYMELIHSNPGEEKMEFRMKMFLAGLEAHIFTEKLALFFEENADVFNKMLDPIRSAKQQRHRFESLTEYGFPDDESE